MVVFFHEIHKLRKHISPYIGLFLMALFIVFEFYQANTSLQQFVQQLQNQFHNMNIHHGIVRLSKSSTDYINSLKSPFFISHAFTWSTAILSTTGPVVSSIIGAVIMGNEYRFGTNRMLLTVERSRIAILFAKVVTLFCFVVFMILFLNVVGLSVVIVIHLFDHVGKPSSIDLGSLAIQLVASFLTLFLWGIFSFVITILSRSTMVGALAGIIWPMFESIFLDHFPIRFALPLFNQKSMMQSAFLQIGQNGPVSFNFTMHPASFDQAFFVCLAYLILTFFIGIIVYQKQSFQ